MNRGFSLLELSIVLVIIGLLAGGVMTGQALIRAAEMRAVSTEYTRFSTALNAFRDKYQAVPGDMKNATAFWGKDNTNCSGNSGTTATPGTCNGDGNGKLADAAVAFGTGEIFRLWQQLALAGMLEGNYTGLAGNSPYDSIPGTNIPASRMSNGGWGTFTADNSGGDSTSFKYDYGNALLYGSRAASWGYAQETILKPEEAWNIDTKLDDGKPAQGKVIAKYWATGATVCATAATNADTSATYSLTNSGIACALIFAKTL